MIGSTTWNGRGAPGRTLGKMGRARLLDDWEATPVPVVLGKAVQREAFRVQRRVRPHVPALRVLQRNGIPNSLFSLPDTLVQGSAVRELRAALLVLDGAGSARQVWGASRYVAWAVQAAEPKWSRAHQDLGYDLAALVRAVEKAEDARRTQRLHRRTDEGETDGR